MPQVTDTVAQQRIAPTPSDASQVLDQTALLTKLAAENLALRQQAVEWEQEISESRARLLSIAAQERRQIERDLHDGAQQRLVALRIELGLAAELVRDQPAECEVRLHDLLSAVDDALTELRAFTQGGNPPLLADHGLDVALRAAAARSPVPARLRSPGVGRLPVDVETAVYFCVLEALQNVAKHAINADHVWIELQLEEGELRFSVQDDGAGMGRGTVTPGAGVTNMRDRMASVDGHLEVLFEDQVGTRVSGTVPTSARAHAPLAHRS